MMLSTTDLILSTLESITGLLVLIKLQLILAAVLHKVNLKSRKKFYLINIFIEIVAIIKNALRQEETKLFAAFGNVLADDADQALWLAPICSNAGCEPSAQCDVAQNTFVSGLHYRVFYQNTGFIQAPQKKV